MTGITIRDPELNSGWLKLSFYHNRHNNRSSSRKKVAVFGDLSTKPLYQLTSFDLRIFNEELLIGRADSLEDLLVDIHHLIGMNKSTRIDKYMSSNRTSPGILFESEDQYAILCELLSISECISGNDSNRESIDIKCIKRKLHRIARDLSSLESQNFSSTENIVIENESLSSFWEDERWTRSHTCRNEWIIRKSKYGTPRSKSKWWSHLDICHETFDITDSSGGSIISKELKKSARFEECRVIYIFAKWCNNLTSRIDRRKSKCW